MWGAIRESYGLEPGGLGVSLPKLAILGVWGEISKNDNFNCYEM